MTWTTIYETNLTKEWPIKKSKLQNAYQASIIKGGISTFYPTIASKFTGLLDKILKLAEEKTTNLYAIHQPIDKVNFSTWGLNALSISNGYLHQLNQKPRQHLKEIIL